MMREKLHDLKRVTQAQYLADFHQVKEIQAREQAIYRDLDRLNRHEACSEQKGHLNSMRIIGADLLWQSWQEQTRQRLNMDLARTRATKLEILDRVRLSFGRDQAIQELLRRAEQKRAKTKKTRNIEQIGI